MESVNNEKEEKKEEVNAANDAKKKEEVKKEENNEEEKKSEQPPQRSIPSTTEKSAFRKAIGCGILATLSAVCISVGVGICLGPGGILSPIGGGLVGLEQS